MRSNWRELALRAIGRRPRAVGGVIAVSAGLAAGLVSLVGFGVDSGIEVAAASVVLVGASIVIMPWLARAKRLAGAALGSRLVIADAAETRLCAWLSVSTFAGLAAFSLFGWTWLDAVAGFVIAGFAVMEGREAWQGETCCDDD